MSDFELTLGEEDIFPKPKTLEELIEVQVAKVNDITSAKIVQGFDHVITRDHVDHTYHFSYDSDDQQNFTEMTNSVAISMNLGNTPEEELKKQYGTTPDGNLDKSKLPCPLPDEWVEYWRGHDAEGPHTLALNIYEYTALAAAAGLHKKKCLGEGWEIVAKLQAAKDEADLQRIVTELNLDRIHPEAVESLTAVGRVASSTK